MLDKLNKYDIISKMKVSEFVYEFQIIGRLDKSEMAEYAENVNKLGYSAEFCICCESTILTANLTFPGCKHKNCFWFLWNDIKEKTELKTK